MNQRNLHPNRPSPHPIHLNPKPVHVNQIKRPMKIAIGPSIYCRLTRHGRLTRRPRNSPRTSRGVSLPNPAYGGEPREPRGARIPFPQEESCAPGWAPLDSNPRRKREGGSGLLVRLKCKSQFFGGRLQEKNLCKEEEEEKKKDGKT